VNNQPFRLTSLSHGGGCGCKLAPSVLSQLLAGHPTAKAFPQLLVGIETGDDAAVYQVDDNTCIIATTDFFMPMVDDPRDFGRIAATNAISDVYAMGGKPILALAILGMPVDKIPTELVREILAGGQQVCGIAGIPIAGGHSIDSPEPIYGLAVIGICRPEHVRRNSDAKPGDVLILTKPVGVGIYSAAIKKGLLSPAGYADMIAATTQLNAVGAVLATTEPAVHAITDITGFGLAGHALEVARGSKLTVTIDAGKVPLLPLAAELAQAGHVTGASGRNWGSFGAHISLPTQMPEWQRHVFCDPQTSGGLLVSVAADRANAVLATIKAAGFLQAAIIGHAKSGDGKLVIV
jgi:selenide, water dikinase